jgi:hypothetical protein
MQLLPLEWHGSGGAVCQMHARPDDNMFERKEFLCAVTWCAVCLPAGCPPGLLPRGEVCTTDAQCCKGSCLLVDEWTEGRKRCEC